MAGFEIFGQFQFLTPPLRRRYCCSEPEWRRGEKGKRDHHMPPRLLLLLLLPRGGLLPPLRRRSPALSPLLRRTPSNKPPGYLFLSPVRAFSRYSGMAAGSPEQQLRSVVVRETVELTEKEEQIFGRLLDVVRHFGLGTQLRVAGGWVRDKVNFFVPAFFPFNYKGKLSLGPLDWR